MGAKRIFFRGGPIGDFSRSTQNYFSRGVEVVKFHFFFSKIRKEPFLLNISQENIIFQNPGEAKAPLSDAHDFIASGDSRMKKVGGPLRGQGKSRGGKVNIYLAW